MIGQRTTTNYHSIGIMNFLLGTRSTKPQVKPPPEAQPGEPSKSHSAMSSKHGRNTPMTKSEEFTFVMQDSSDEVQRSHIPVTSSEIKIKDSAEPRAALQKKDEEIEHLKSELNHLFYFSKDQEAGTSNLTKTIAAADKKMRSLQQGLEASQRDLQACRDDLFRFQPAAQVPDSNIAKDYDLLCHEVTNWIDEEIVAFEKSTQYTKSEQLFSAPEGSEVAVLLDEYPESGEHLISYLVHSCLVEAIFGESVYLLGLSEGATKLLQKAEQGMEKLESKKGGNLFDAELLTSSNS